MSARNRGDKTIYKVVVDREGQYSIWPADRENALGWHDAGKSGTMDQCVAHIEKIWTRRRPRSIRQHLKETGVLSEEEGGE